MAVLPFLSSIDRLPRPAWPKRAAQELKAWRQDVGRGGEADGALGAFATALAEDVAGRSLLEAVFGNSSFLSQCLMREPQVLQMIALKGFDATFDAILADLGPAAQTWTERPATMAALRTAKRRVALTVALADITSVWSLEKVTGALTAFAEVALGAALSHLLLEANRAGVLDLAEPEEPEKSSGIAILAMGKMGAAELNYSSDIDLMVLFDAERVAYRGSEGPQQALHRMVRDLIAFLGERTRDGYVFRTDLRLRPDPGSSPLAVSTAAAERYYESLGQNWERAALIKARAVAGDREVGEQFLARLTPFIWRKNLDFAAIEDIHSIKRQINAHKGHHEIAVAGHNIKVGRGGIREIEFYAQTQQLIWGGRMPELRRRGTCAALRALQEAGHADKVAVDHLIGAYGFLRRLEHRLQMIDDESTHTLPDDEESLRAIATFMGYDGTTPFAQDLRLHLERVERHYAALFEDAPELGGAKGNLVFTGTEDDPDTLRTLGELGFSDGTAVSTTIRGWHHGRIRATRSTRARELLTELMPHLLVAFSETVNPDAAFRKFDEFLTNLPAGIQLFSLFYANPKLLNLLAEIMGSAPSLAERLSRNPALLEGVLTGDFYGSLDDASALRADLEQALKQAHDLQDVLDLTRRWAHDREFQVGMQLFRNLIPGEEAGNALTDVADAVLACLLPPVADEFARQHGRLPGGRFVVVGMGKLGGREMTFSSDLDLIFIYSCEGGLETESDGPRPLPVGEYYARLSQRLVGALSAMTPEGRLYDIDTRLRPSGHSGPIASEIEGFAAYQQQRAWTWEHMALTRARVVAGDPDLAARTRAVICDTLTGKRNDAALVRDVSDMRRRIDAERHTENHWMLKHSRGGLLDLEFIAQYLQLRHGAAQPEVLSPFTAEAFDRLAQAGALPRADASELAAASIFLRRLQALLRLTVGVSRDESRFPEGLRAALARAVDVEDFAALKARLEHVQSRVRAYYARLIDEPARRAAAATGENDHEQGNQ